MLQKKYAKTQEAALASYSYTDIAAGTGVQTFYGANATSGANFFLTTDTPYSERVLTVEAATATANYQKEIDVDFDVDLNLPRDIKGDLIASVPFGIGWKETTSNDVFIYCVVTLKKVSGGTETTIATATGKPFIVTGTATPQAMDALVLDVTKTHYKKGDTIRITVELWAKKEAGADSVHIMLGHDPQNRAYGFWDQTTGGAAKDYDFGTNPTNLNFKIPFDLDL